jgi:hypothetical protein
MLQGMYGTAEVIGARSVEWRENGAAGCFCSCKNKKIVAPNPVAEGRMH